MTTGEALLLVVTAMGFTATVVLLVGILVAVTDRK